MTVCAAVVTHNRLADLQRAVAALRAQTQPPDAILIVDNASTDATAAWLAEQPNLLVVRQGNLGSGGGQATALRVSAEHGFEWTWCSDDDALPAPDALAALRAATAALGPAFFNSVVVAPDGTSLSFQLADLSRPERPVLRTLAEVQARPGPFDSLANFFNGTLVPRAFVEQHGLPRAELFIRGDEVEYVLRARAAGWATYTVPGSLVVHPAEQATERWFLGRRKAMPLLPPLKLYYNWRNILDLNDRYDYLYPGRGQSWRRARVLPQLLWELGFWYRLAAPARRALVLAVTDWQANRFRTPEQLPSQLAPRSAPAVRPGDGRPVDA
jgi:GT2 family glycosyltransferase